MLSTIFFITGTNISSDHVINVSFFMQPEVEDVDEKVKQFFDLYTLNVGKKTPSALQQIFTV